MSFLKTKSVSDIVASFSTLTKELEVISQKKLAETQLNKERIKEIESEIAASEAETKRADAIAANIRKLINA